MRLVLLGFVLFSGFCFAGQLKDWEFTKENPVTKNRVVAIRAESLDQSSNSHTKYLHNVTAWLYDSRGNVTRTIKSKEAVANLDEGTLRYGPDLKSVLKLR